LSIYFKSPKSFTGEDVVEFQCHGGAVIRHRDFRECQYIMGQEITQRL